jgi:hypothetical protein
MVSMTRAEAKEAFNHVLDTVVDRADSSSLKSSLYEDGITDIFDLITVTDDVIDNLTYEDSDDKIYYPVKKGDKMLLRCLLAYHQSLESVTGDVDYNTITQANFDSYRISPAYRAHLYQPYPTLSSPAPTTSLPTASSQPLHFSPVAMFHRTIKKDPSLFPTLKDDKYHDVWHRSFNTQAVAQDVSDLLHETYVPSTADDIALFVEKQKFVYAVLESKVLTDRGKAIICDHEHDFDAQKVYKKLKDYHLKSTKAKIESSVLLSYITSAKLGDCTWNGTTEAFVINWQNQVRLYKKTVPPLIIFPIVRNALCSNGIDELRQVKNTVDHMATTSGTTLTYNEYVTLLLSAASAYDDQFKPKQSFSAIYSFVISRTTKMITMMTSPLIQTPPLTLTTQSVPSRPMLPTFDPNTHLNLILLRLGCPPKSGLVWMPPAKPFGIVLMIQQSLSFWVTSSKSRNRIAQQATLLRFDVRLSINLVNAPSRPK